mmetsp:Transcript_14990/g.42474  ORF Transcript_14990/g.42474 Transcript_14990/m.42474 type:complete len:223 (+) Transcript_14990:724-1392(+)
MRQVLDVVRGDGVGVEVEHVRVGEAHERRVGLVAAVPCLVGDVGAVRVHLPVQVHVAVLVADIELLPALEGGGAHAQLRFHGGLGLDGVGEEHALAGVDDGGARERVQVVHGALAELGELAVVHDAGVDVDVRRVGRGVVGRGDGGVEGREAAVAADARAQALEVVVGARAHGGVVHAVHWLAGGVARKGRGSRCLWLLLPRLASVGDFFSRASRRDPCTRA